MNQAEKTEIESYASEIIRRYFCHGDVEFLISSFAPDIVWLGGGKAQKAEGAENVARYFRAARATLLPCRVWDEEYVTVEQAPGVYLCEGRSELESASPETLMRIQQRVTFIFRREKGRLLVSHIHNSVPYDSIQPYELFPIEKGQRAYRQLLERVGEQSRQIELMLSQIPGGMMVCHIDPDFSLIWASEGLYSMLGYSNKEDLRRHTAGTCRGVTMPEDFAEVQALIGNSLAKGDSYSIECRVLRKDGAILWVSVTGKRYTDDNGESRICAVVTNVTDRVERNNEIAMANEEIARHTNWLSQLYNAVPCGIIQFTLTPFPKTISINRRALEIYGCAEEGYDKSRHDPFSMVEEADRTWLRRDVEALTREDGRVEYERQFFRKDGVQRWISAVMEPFVTREGIRVIQAIITDITDNKRMQMEREQEQMVESRLLRTAVHSAYQQIISFNLTRNTYQIISQDRHMFSPAISGTLDAFVEDAENNIAEEYRGKFRSLFNPATIKTGMGTGEKELYVELRRNGADGLPHWVSYHCIHVESSTEQDTLCILLVKILDDQRTEQARQEQLLRDALAAAQSASKAKSDFLSRMSHDIRTPMNAIIGMSAIGQIKIDSKDRALDCFRKIDISSRYLLSLLNEILDMARIESGKMTIASTRFDFIELITEINSIFHPQAMAGGITYAIYHEEPLDRYYEGDALRIKQILANLLSNALKFTPAGGAVSLRIREQRRAHGFASLEFQVEDTGQGMTEDFLQRIFQPFEQESTEIARDKVGTGLGLTIVHSLVQLMGGAISVQSEKERGTVFTVLLPLRCLHSDHEEEQRRRYRELLQDMQVLVVDDDPIVGEQVSLIMGDIGARTHWVDSGFKAVECVREASGRGQHYHVALVDWLMPGMDGVETTRQLRTIVGPDTTIIIITAYDLSTVESEARAAGADAFITKPLFQSTLCDAVLQCHSEQLTEAAVDEVEADFAGKRVLLVEDNEINMEISRALLELSGIEVDWAENGRVALDRVRQHRTGHYHCVFMDIRMPVMDGLDATRAIRALPGCQAADLPVIALSANAFEEDKVIASEAGMNDYLAKPMELSKLSAMLKRWL